MTLTKKCESHRVLYKCSRTCVYTILFCVFFHRAPGEKKPFFTVNGEWNGVMYYKEAKDWQSVSLSEVCSLVETNPVQKPCSEKFGLLENFLTMCFQKVQELKRNFDLTFIDILACFLAFFRCRCLVYLGKLLCLNIFFCFNLGTTSFY